MKLTVAVVTLFLMMGFGLNHQRDVIVVLDRNTSQETVLARHNISPHKKFKHALNGFTAKLSMGEILALGLDSNVRYIELDAPATTFAQTVPWGITQVGATQSSQQSGDGQGSTTGVRVYIVDTADGFEQNTDLNAVPGPPPPPPFAEGYVRNASTGVPIYGAGVRIYLDPTCPNYPCSWVSGISDSTGHYEISYSLESGSYLMGVSGLIGYENNLKMVDLVAAQTNLIDWNMIPTSAPPPPPPSTGGIAGVVRRADTGQAIGGIAVSIASLSLSRTTDSQGAYSFSNIQVGNYSVNADAVGYLGQTKSVSVFSGQVSQLDFSLAYCIQGERGNSNKCRGGQSARHLVEVASDCVGHATHVAGTAAAIDNDLNVVGVAPGAELVAVKVFQGCFSSTTISDIIAGLDWIIANGQKPGVVNMSLGGGYSQALNEATNAVRDAGFVVAVAAGNDGVDACTISPASAGAGIDNGILTVAATDATNQEPSWSNYGSCVDVWAPGVNVESTCNDGATCVKSGTSMASPHGAGAAALYLSTHPSATPIEVEAAIKQQALPTGTISKDGRAIQLLNVRQF